MNTKKMRILILVMIGLLIASIGGYIAVDKMKTAEEQAEIKEANSLKLFNFDENAIQKVNLQFEEGNFTVEKNSDGWAITDTDYPHSVTLNAYYINTICNYMSSLTADKKLTVSQEELANYGLENPQPLTCSDGHGEYTLYIGNASATEEYYYVMLPNDSTVYAIDFDKGQIMKGGLTYLKDPYMIGWIDVNINYVKLERKKEKEIAFEIARDEQNRWQMAEPLKNTPINGANVNSMLTVVTRLQIDKFIKVAEDSKELAEYHLDKPAYQLSLKNENGETLTIHFSDFQDSDTEVYLYYEETGQIASMLTQNVSFLQTKPSELMTDKIYSPDIIDVSALDVTVDDLHFNISMNHDESQAFFCPDGNTENIEISAMEDDIQKIFNELFRSVSNLTYDSLDIGAKPPENTEPAVIFHYTLTDGTETEMTLIPVDDTFYQAFLNGEYTGKIVRRRALSGNAGVLTYYEKLTDALNLTVYN